MTTSLVDVAGLTGKQTYNKQLMPSVFVQKVTLETGSDIIIREDPHIDHEWEGTYVTDKYGTRKITYSGFSLMDEPPSSDGLSVKLDLIVKDEVRNEAVSSWFYDIQVLKYMKVRIIQSRDKNLSIQLKKGKLSALTNPKFANKYEEKIISLQKEGEDVSNFYSASETGRGLISSIPYQTSFFSKKSDPKHLAYYIFCYFDIAELSEDYNLSLYGFDYKNGIISENITSETVIENYKVVSEAEIFYTPEGKIWAGPVHEHNGVYMAGVQHTSAPHPILTRQVVINTTVQDFRNMQQIIGQQIDLKPVQSLIEGLKESYNSSKVIIEDKPSYFSNAFASRSIDTSSLGAAKFVFSFNYAEFIKQESKYGQLLESGDHLVRNRIKSLTKIKSIKVFRYRVEPNKSSNALGSTTIGGIYSQRPYDTSQEAPVLIVGSSDLAAGSLRPATSEKPKSAVTSEAKETTLVGSIMETKISNTDNMRNFAVTDYSYSAVTDGHYQYSVEVEVEDGTVAYLKELLAGLQSSVVQLSKYHDLSYSPSFYDANSGEFNSSFLQNYMPTAVVSGNNGVLDFSSSPWVEPIAKLVEVLRVLASTTSSQAIFQSLYKIINPITGTPEGISAVLGLLREIEHIFESILGSSAQVDLTLKSGTSGTSRSTVMTTDNLFSHIFDADLPNLYGLSFLDMRDKNGYAGLKSITIGDYSNRLIYENQKYLSGLGATEPIPYVVDSPLATVPPSISGYIGDFTTYAPSYLTPMSARNGAGSVWDSSTATKNKTNNFSIRMLGAMDRGHVGEMQKTNSGITDVEKVDFLGGLGVSVMSPEVSHRIEASDTYGSTNLAASSFLGEESLFAKDTVEYSNNMAVVPMYGVDEVINIFSSDLNFNTTQPYGLDNDLTALENQETSQLSIKDFTSTPLEPIVEDILDAYIIPLPDGASESPVIYNVSTIQKIPNQIKSIFYSGQPNFKYNFFEYEYDFIRNPDTANTFIWNYQVIAQVEYLSGYEISNDGSVQISSPSWSLLDRATFESLQAGDLHSLLCRLVKYSDSNFKIGQSRFADIPYYQDHFVIAKNDNAARSRTVPPYNGGMTLQQAVYNNLRKLGSQYTSVLMDIPSSTYLSTNKADQRKPRNSGDAGYYDALRDNKTNVVVQIVDATDCTLYEIPEIVMPEPPVAEDENVYGCTDPKALNYNRAATANDGSCEYAPDPIYGCTDPAATNYNPNATATDQSCVYPEQPAEPTTTGTDDDNGTDGGTTTGGNQDNVYGCTDPKALNYDPMASVPDGSCEYAPEPIYGCTDPAAKNYNPQAEINDGSCILPETPTVTDSDGDDDKLDEITGNDNDAGDDTGGDIDGGDTFNDDGNDDDDDKPADPNDTDDNNDNDDGKGDDTDDDGIKDEDQWTEEVKGNAKDTNEDSTGDDSSVEEIEAVLEVVVDGGVDEDFADLIDEYVIDLDKSNDIDPNDPYLDPNYVEDNDDDNSNGNNSAGNVSAPATGVTATGVTQPSVGGSGGSGY